MAITFKVLHFQELDWLIYFPTEGNKGKYYSYNVRLRERKGSPQQNQAILGTLLERAELSDHYPHNVGFFKAACEEAPDGEVRYMEIRTIHNVDELWMFLNALNL